MQRFLPLDPLSLRAGTGPCQSLVPGSTSYVRSGAKNGVSWATQDLVPAGTASSPQNGSGYFHKGWCPHGQRSQCFSG